MDLDSIGATWHAALSVSSGVLIAAGALAYAYGLNALADCSMDTDKGKNALAGVDEIPGLVRWFVAITGMATLALASAQGTSALIAALVSIFAGTIYSVGPRLKAVPVVGTLLNVPIFAPLLFVGVRNHPPAAMPLLVVCFSVLLVMNQLLHECADLDEDRRGGLVSTALLLGEGRIKPLIIAIALSGGLCAFMLASAPAVGLLAGITMLLVGGIALLPAAPALRRQWHRWGALFAGGVIKLASMWPFIRV